MRGTYFWPPILLCNKEIYISPNYVMISISFSWGSDKQHLSGHGMSCYQYMICNGVPAVYVCELNFMLTTVNGVTCMTGCQHSNITGRSNVIF